MVLALWLPCVSRSRFFVTFFFLKYFFFFWFLVQTTPPTNSRRPLNRESPTVPYHAFPGDGGSDQGATTLETPNGPYFNVLHSPRAPPNMETLLLEPYTCAPVSLSER